jgi:hypothetical protein
MSFRPYPGRTATSCLPSITSPSSGRENFRGSSSHGWRHDSFLCCDFPSPSFRSHSSPSLPLASWRAAQRAAQSGLAGKVWTSDHAFWGRTWQFLCRDVSSGCIRKHSLTEPDVGRPYHIMYAIITETVESLGQLEDLGAQF